MVRGPGSAAQRLALERLWQDRCTVYVTQTVRDPQTGLCSHRRTAAYENIPCKLSFYTAKTAEQEDTASSRGAAGRKNAAETYQRVKLFLGPEYHVPPGSQVEVRRGGRRLLYAASGEPAVFSCCQEIRLKREGYA